MFQEVRMGKTVDAERAQRLVEEISESLARNASALISLARLKTADDYTYMRVGSCPIGSLVRLASGRVGVVVEQTLKSLTTPCVKVFFSPKANSSLGG